MSYSKRKGKYRSIFEWKVADALRKLKVSILYEVEQLSYIVPAREAKYTPDFKLPNGILVECKGRFSLDDRKKMVNVIKSNPSRDIRMLFQNASVKIRKGSKTSYADWCDKQGIKWAEGNVPQSWIREKKR